MPQSPNEALQPDAPPPPPPKPPSRRRPTLSAISGFLSFLVIAAIGVLVAIGYSTMRVNEPGPLEADKVVYIAQHTDLPDIIEKLQNEGVIDSPFTLNAMLTVERKRSKVKFGEYMFKAHASLRTVVDTLVGGKQLSHPITIPEGLTSQQVVQRLRDNDLLTGELRNAPNEGELLPETYKVNRGMSRVDLIAKMKADQRRVVEQIWSHRAQDLPLSSPFELITLASIVEKETGKADERPRVAGVFVNRLKRHMRLQSDPTIVYGLVQGQGTLGHSITRSELDKRTPYNTYQIDGLPPGPITNPGRAALEAVANPSRTGDLYFVADGTGGHVFSGSIEEHNRNVAHWRQIQREAKEKGEADKGDVDKLAPSAAPPSAPHGRQRSDASDAATFGTLVRTISTVSRGRIAAFTDPQRNHDIAKVAAAEAAGVPRGRGRARRTPRVDVKAMTASLDQMGFSVEGVRASASELLDGPLAPSEQPTTNAAPVSAGMPGPALAYLPPASAAAAAAKPLPKVRDAKAALDVAPGAQHNDLFADPNPSGAPVAPMRTPPAHPKIYDVSEGTSLDPLKNKSYDLNSGKTIPAEFVSKQ